MKEYSEVFRHCENSKGVNKGLADAYPCTSIPLEGFRGHRSVLGPIAVLFLIESTPPALPRYPAIFVARSQARTSSKVCAASVLARSSARKLAWLRFKASRKIGLDEVRRALGRIREPGPHRGAS